LLNLNSPALISLLISSKLLSKLFLKDLMVTLSMPFDCMFFFEIWRHASRSELVEDIS